MYAYLYIYRATDLRSGESFGPRGVLLVETTLARIASEAVYVRPCLLAKLENDRHTLAGGRAFEGSASHSLGSSVAPVTPCERQGLLP